MVVLEAMLFGKPILCSSEAGVKEIIKEGINGFVFAPKDLIDLKNKIEFFINKKKMIEKMGKASKEIMKELTPEIAVKKLSTVIQELLN